jgi:hypothetical protein
VCFFFLFYLIYFGTEGTWFFLYIYVMALRVILYAMLRILVNMKRKKKENPCKHDEKMCNSTKFACSELILVNI